MEILTLLLVLLLIWLLVAPILALARSSEAERQAREAHVFANKAWARVQDLEIQLRKLQASNTVSPSPPKPNDTLTPIPEPVRKRESAIPEPTTPPALPVFQFAKTATKAPEPTNPAPTSEEPATESFSIEQFMGAKMFAWLGGVAMFFGVIFFVKYAFENNLIPPPLRTALGFITGIGLLIGGLLTHRLERYRVLAQAFCATAVLILYGVTFAAHAVYQFPLFGTIQSFLLMALITGTAFFIAVRLNALVVAVLGMLGGFITPVLLSTGQDQVLGLFGYIALLDIGLLAVSRHRNWTYLTTGAAIGTVLIQIGWFEKFFVAGRYFEGSATLIPMAIFIGFIALFLAGGWIRKWQITLHSAISVQGLASVATMISFNFLKFDSINERYFLLYGFLFIVQLGVIASVALRPRFGWAQLSAAALIFLHLAIWTSHSLLPDRLFGILWVYLLFGALHAAAPLVIFRKIPENTSPITLRVGPWFPSLLVLMMLLPILHLSPVPMVLWVGVLLANLMVIGLALINRAFLPVLSSLILSLGVIAIWLLKSPVKIDVLNSFFGLIIGFSGLFAIAGKYLQCVSPHDDRENTPNQIALALLPVCAGVFPYALLILALLQVPVADPSAIFGVALLMAALLAALTLFTPQKGPLLLVALAGTLAVESIWHLSHFKTEFSTVPMSWYVGINLFFLLLPFAFRQRCTTRFSPWIASALACVGHFLLILSASRVTFPNAEMGLIPAAYAVPALLAFYAVYRLFPTMDENQQSRLAWFGGVALLFITLIFPIQFDRQWLTISWAIEGALLLWLFRHVPHPGLQATGVTLLGISLFRLTLNPAVFNSYPRSGHVIFNWHLYTYGIVAIAQAAGAYLFTDPQGRMEKFQPRACLWAACGILFFLLLNLEIADYFTAPGDRCIAFRFGGHFARDMTYTIAWGLFSLALIAIGFRWNSKQARYAAICLLIITLLKLFLHDLAAVKSIFRIGALIGVALIAFITSFLYQRFFDQSKS